MSNRFEVITWKASELPPDWFKRKRAADKDNLAVKKAVREIIEAVRQRGDEALLEYTEKFDKTKLAARTSKLPQPRLKPLTR